MKLYTLDFETYWDQDYTLKKLTTEEYIRDPRFEVLCCSIRSPDGAIERVPQAMVPEALEAIPWNEVALIAHHAQFEGLILSHHFGMKPRAWIDTISVARLLVGIKTSLSLENLSRYFGFGGKTIDYSFKGKHWHELSAYDQHRLLEGNAHDTALTYAIAMKMLPAFPPCELPIIDMTVRMFTEPRLYGDIDLLAKIWMDEQMRKSDLMAKLGVTEAELQSAATFVQLLEAEGVEVPTKATAGGEAPCLAKTDTFMQDLLDDEDERVQGLAMARLGVKSTITQARAERLGYMATRGKMCVYLNYFGAVNTSRWSGGDKTNFQNMNRKGELRHSITAGPDEELAIIDLSQIECRMLNTLAGQWDVVERFRNGEDPYANVASQFYQRPITKDDKFERGMGKQSELMCGYGCGPARFKAVARQGNYGPPVHLSDEEAHRFVYLYRNTHPAVVQYWNQANWILGMLHSGATVPWGPMTVANGWILLPGGIPLRYDLVNTVDGWRRKTRFGNVNIYGAKLIENIVQALARVAYSEAVSRVYTLHGHRPVLSSHDEAVYCVTRGREEAEPLLAEFKKPLPWLPACPVDAELIVSRRYEK